MYGVKPRADRMAAGLLVLILTCSLPISLVAGESGSGSGQNNIQGRLTGLQQMFTAVSVVSLCMCS